MDLKKIKIISILNNNRAVLGLPLRLTVCLIIGSAALMFILLYIYNPCLIPEKMVVDVDPLVNIIPKGKNKESFTIFVHVSDKNGFNIQDANIIIKGLGDAEINKTNEKGISKLELTPYLAPGINEGYLDIEIQSSCKESFSQNKLIKIVREA